MQNRYEQTEAGDYTSRQWASLMFHMLGMPKKAETVLKSTEKQFEFYIKLIKLLSKNNREILELLEFTCL